MLITKINSTNNLINSEYISGNSFYVIQIAYFFQSPGNRSPFVSKNIKQSQFHQINKYQQRTITITKSKRKIEELYNKFKFYKNTYCFIHHTFFMPYKVAKVNCFCKKYNIIYQQFQIMQGTSSKLQPQPPVELKPKVSPQLLKKYRQIFDSFDKQQDGYVQAKDVPGVLRILGVSMTEQQVVESLGDRAIKSDNPIVSSKIDFADFLALIVDKQSQMSMKEQLMESFRVFDIQKNGTIPLSELRYYLRTYGIAMNEQQVQQLLKESQPEDGVVKYQKFIDKMLDKA